jgi:ubiquinone/menaquinone biosynthesis C-methylase UbiE
VKPRNLISFLSSSDKDKQLEKERYEKKAMLEFDGLPDKISNTQKSALGILLNQPHEEYYRRIKESVTSTMKVLELGAGTGTHTGILLETGAEITALDISPFSLKVLQKKFGQGVQVVCASMEAIPLPAAKFDVIVSAGSLSYVDFQELSGEIRRLLKKDGALILIDSLNHNPVYRLNRFVRFLLKQRSYSTLLRMPTMGTINSFRGSFMVTEIRFFGAYLWFLAPLSKMLPAALIKTIDLFLQKRFPSGKNSFKFVLYCKNMI